MRQKKPTGFEEYHTDGPLTASQVAEDQERYQRYPQFMLPV